MTFKARWSAVCSSCDEPIVKGAEARYVREEIVHAECEGKPRQTPAETCPDCFLEKPCGCGEF